MFTTLILLQLVASDENRGVRPEDDQQFNLLCKLNSDNADYFSEVDAFATLGNIIASIAQPLAEDTHRNVTLPSEPILNTVNISINDTETGRQTPLDDLSTILTILTSISMFLSTANFCLSLLLYLRPLISPSLYVRANNGEQLEMCQQSTQL